ncbi:hypothetical protein MA4S0726RB_4103 [Mycobacteroides abscessus 4S-0726-RB]|nr:hypothetical protein MA4S0726RB_4103 [Mycobacteroides abscessus 4S-0726-RB]EIT96315.1 hypothetical protein MA4S0726RA_4512 [Mycobacteroides abscessus 4S-0726-RA]EIV47585.1 hypothetical protein MA4S0116R_4537 [Mycobacteroides abscessus 4S-0116-R]EIV60748.1 hypothetical protein MA4S0116S_3650 [Mycobacteroides abscessus 4S-0116-S]
MYCDHRAHLADSIRRGTAAQRDFNRVVGLVNGRVYAMALRGASGEVHKHRIAARGAAPGLEGYGTAVDYSGVVLEI